MNNLYWFFTDEIREDQMSRLIHSAGIGLEVNRFFVEKQERHSASFPFIVWGSCIAGEDRVFLAGMGIRNNFYSARLVLPIRG